MDDKTITEAMGMNIDQKAADLRGSECDGLLSAADVCKWNLTEGESSLWNASCGDAWLIVDGHTPEDAKLIFCPMCGRKVVGA